MTKRLNKQLSDNILITTLIFLYMVSITIFVFNLSLFFKLDLGYMIQTNQTHTFLFISNLTGRFCLVSFPTTLFVLFILHYRLHNGNTASSNLGNGTKKFLDIMLVSFVFNIGLMVLPFSLIVYMLY